MNPPKLYLGCPVWAQEKWRGNFFTRDARREEFLAQYGSVFKAVEGNSSFYALQSEETVARWAAEAPEGLAFCWKFPRAITHDLALVNAEKATEEFLVRMASLGKNLGPFFIQLHASFGRKKLPQLDAYLRGLPKGFRYAVEVRSPDFFDGGAGEEALHAVLGESGVERVVFDTRRLFAAMATDAATLDAKRKKPRVPVRFTAVGQRPFVRFVGDPVLENNDAALREWAGVVARWIGEGRTPYFFVHHPDDRWAPALARRFQALLHEHCPRVPAPPIWPGERDRAAEQMSLL